MDWAAVLDSIRYWVAVAFVVTVPPAIAWWVAIHPFARFWRRLGATASLWTLSIFSLGVVAALLPFRGLRERFGRAYEEYAERVPRYVPRRR